MKKSEKEILFEQKMFNIAVIMGSLLILMFLYNGVLMLETQESVFDMETYIIMPLFIICGLIRYYEAIYKKPHRKILLSIYVLLIIISIIGFTTSSILEQLEDTPYAFGIMLGIIGLVIYDVTTAKYIATLQWKIVLMYNLYFLYLGGYLYDRSAIIKGTRKRNKRS